MLAKRLFMIRPAAFGYNASTAETNSFQQHDIRSDAAKALEEFDNCLEVLEAADIEVLLAHDQAEPVKPDAIFPNNWFSTHPDGQLILYPMHTDNRQLEATDEHIGSLQALSYHQLIDLRAERNQARYLEGTGSLVFDHLHRLAVAVPSARTNRNLAKALTSQLGYALYMPEAVDSFGKPIYHTNVVMSIAPELAICCFKAIPDHDQAHILGSLLQRSGRRVIPISLAQMSAFCANVLMVYNRKGEKCLLLSETAWEAYEAYQQAQLAAAAHLVKVQIPTIEALGGGGIRCMVAELW